MTATTPGYSGRIGNDARTDRPRTLRTFTETKAFYKTSEFMVWILSVAAVLVVTRMSGNDSLSSWHGWLLVTVLSSAYMFSRGIAKSGAREPYTRDTDDR
jgi:hypothetical protein